MEEGRLTLNVAVSPNSRPDTKRPQEKQQALSASLLLGKSTHPLWLHFVAIRLRLP